YRTHQGDGAPLHRPYGCGTGCDELLQVQRRWVGYRQHRHTHAGYPVGDVEVHLSEHHDGNVLDSSTPGKCGQESSGRGPLQYCLCEYWRFTETHGFLESTLCPNTHQRACGRDSA